LQCCSWRGLGVVWSLGALLGEWRISELTCRCVHILRSMIWAKLCSYLMFNLFNQSTDAVDASLW
jgi:hypothetical protein